MYKNVYAKSLSQILFLLFVCLLATGFRAPVNTREACEQLIEEARKDDSNKNYTAALEKLLRAEAIATEYHWKDLMSNVKNHIGLIYVYFSNYGEALNYFQESLEIAQNDESLHNNKVLTLSNIGFLYAKEKKYEEALVYLNKAFGLAEKDNMERLQKGIANNIANIYNELQQPEKSLKILLEVANNEADETVDFLWEAIYIRALFINGQITEAKDKANQLEEKLNSDAFSDKVCHVCLNDLLSKIHAKLSNTDTAIHYAKIVLNSTDELIDKVEQYKNIAELYLQKGDYLTTIQYKDSVLIATDLLSTLINSQLYEANKIKFKVSEYQNELYLKKKQQRTERQLFVVVIIFGLITLFLMVKIFRNKVVKQKHKAVITGLELEKEKKEHLLVEKELETVRLKQQQLKHEIAEKNRELFARTLYLSNRNELIQNIISSLENTPTAKQNKETIEQIKIIKNFLRTDNQRDDFIKHFENVNPDFLSQLKHTHPQLTANDVRFLCYVYMNLSLKEICMVFNITYNACIIRKQRIMDKMGLDKKEVALYDYLLSLNNNKE